ncbi:serine protease [Vulcanococcus limneticus]|jgi:S1-C subfamily serine protease|uniref:S1 family peptidase n=1 Tax=Vulcanococcus limneticus TaxID=2170428 RepID=UPI00398BEA48
MPTQQTEPVAINRWPQTASDQQPIASKGGDSHKSRISRYNGSIRVAITVQVINGDQKGSGIIIRDKQKRLWIITNRHVVGESSDVCIAFSDGRDATGSVFQSEYTDDDIAFISVAQLRKDEPYAVPDYQLDSASVNPVVATGYRADTDAYLETPGVTVPILKGKILGSGYSLTYSNQVEKGMSGGGIFSDNDRLIGINALHSDPLWPGDWHDSNGRRLKGGLGRKLDSVSVGIAIENIYSALNHIKRKGTTKPATATCPLKAKNP